MRPRGPCGQRTQDKAHLRQQAQDRRGRCLKNLARLARVDPKLLYPLRHRGEESQAHIALIRSRDVLVEVLRQVEGVGPLTALTFVLTLEDPYRFEGSRSVGAYLGLVPARDRSGERDPQKRISKEGDEMLRRLLVSGAHYILGPFGSDSDLRRHGQKIASRGGKSAKKRAVVAVARKLSVLLHRLWVSGEVYDPLHNAHRRQEQVA